MPKRKSCTSILRCRLPPSTPCLVRQPPVDALRVPDEMPTALKSHIASRWRHAFHRGRRHAILIAPAALSVPTPRDFVPWCISDAGLYGAGMGSSLPASEMPASEMLHTMLHTASEMLHTCFTHKQPSQPLRSCPGTMQH